ncbi:MAG: hypothetical protein WC767_02420 [Candidatus Paceibacterota bacterium]|jgi:hypothetical protein
MEKKDSSRKIKDFRDLEKRIREVRESAIDLSTEEDLAIAVMNLISLEEHLFFSGAKTGKPSYYDSLGEIREMRKVLLARMLPRTEGEAWCVSKHLLSASMRLIEVGTKLRADGKTKDADDMFAYAFKLFNLFFGVRLGIASAPEAIEHAKSEKPMTFDDIMGKLVDCCKE